MNYLIYSLLLLTTISTTAWAQTGETAKEPYPGGPPLKRAGNAAWTVTCTYQSPPVPSVPSSTHPNVLIPQKVTFDPFPIDSRIASETVTKFAQSIREVYTYQNGLTGERWYESGFTICRNPQDEITSGSHDPMASSYINYSRLDFPGFAWIKPGNFIGTKKVGETDCLVFQDNRNSLEATNPVFFRMAAGMLTKHPVNFTQVNEMDDTPHPEFENLTGFALYGYQPKKVLCQAFVNAATRLPVSLIIGDETRQYAFLAPPLAPPVPTGKIAPVIASFIKLIPPANPRHDVP